MEIKRVQPPAPPPVTTMTLENDEEWIVRTALYHYQNHGGTAPEIRTKARHLYQQMYSLT